MVVLAGETSEGLLSDLARRPNISLVRPGDGGGLDAAVEALGRAARTVSPYVLVAADPLAETAAAWQAMWDLSSGPQAAPEFERRAADALAAWRSGRFELPDYYLVLASATPDGEAPGLHLGPLRTSRPARVAVAVAPAGQGSLTSPAHTLSLIHI